MQIKQQGTYVNVTQKKRKELQNSRQSCLKLGQYYIHNLRELAKKK